MSDHFPETKESHALAHIDLKFSLTGGLTPESLRQVVQTLNLTAEQKAQLNFFLNKAERVSQADGGVVDFSKVFETNDTKSLIDETLQKINQQIAVFPNIFSETTGENENPWGIDATHIQGVKAPEKIFLQDGTAKVLNPEEQAAFETVVTKMAKLVAAWKRSQVLLMAAQKLSSVAEISDPFATLNLDQKEITTQIADIEAALAKLERQYLNVALGTGKLNIPHTENLDEQAESGIVTQLPQSLLGIKSTLEAIAQTELKSEEKESINKKLSQVMSLLVLAGLLTSCSAVADQMPQVEPEEPGQVASPKPEAPTSEASDEAPTDAEETDKPSTTTDEETDEPGPTPTATEEKPQYEYTVTPEIKNFRECVVTEEELLDGTYWHWLNEVVAPTLLEEFKAREDQIRDDIPLEIIGLPSGGAFFYPEDNGIYEDEETTAPWNRQVTFAVTSTIDPITNSTLEYLVLPVFYYDKDTQQVFPVITVAPLFHEELLEQVMDNYLNNNMPVIVFSAISEGAFSEETTVMNNECCPLSTKSYNKIGQKEWWQRTQRFSERDYVAYSKPGMLIRTTAIASEAFQ